VLELLLHLGVGESDAGGGAEVERAELAGIEHQVELIALSGLVAAGDGAGAHDGAGDHLGSELQLQARALELIEHAGHSAFADLKWEFGEAMAERVERIVAETGDFAPAALFDSERFENVIHFGGVEIEARGFAGSQAAGAFEEADAV